MAISNYNPAIQLAQIAALERAARDSFSFLFSIDKGIKSLCDMRYRNGFMMSSNADVCMPVDQLGNHPYLISQHGQQFVFLSIKLVPIKIFVHGVLRQSRTSRIVSTGSTSRGHLLQISGTPTETETAIDSMKYYYVNFDDKILPESIRTATLD